MILAFTRGLRTLIVKQTKKKWHAEVRATSRELRGLTIGIIGFGSSGQQVALRASAFGMRILAVDVDEKEKPDYVERIGTAAEICDTIGQSDIVVVATPYTPENRGLIGETEIGVMKDDALLIGISRGGIIDENALLSARLSGVDNRQPWLLLTSAYHMPRAMGVFSQTGWNVTPWAVDYRMTTHDSWFDFSFHYGPRLWALRA